MTIAEMVIRKRELGYSYEQISELSGLPLGTVQKVLGGITKSPRRATIVALESVLGYEAGAQERNTVKEGAAAYAVKPAWRTAEISTEEKDASDEVNSDDIPGEYPGKRKYTLDDYYALPDEVRAELIDGVFYDMASPTSIHQILAGAIHYALVSYIMKNKGKCVPFIAPFDVQLDMDNRTMVEPDVIVVCDRSRILENRVYGAPDLAVEVLSKSTRTKDLVIKTAKYLEAGVREYWIVNPWERTITVYDFEHDTEITTYSGEDTVPVRIFGGNCRVNFGEIFEYTDTLRG